MISDCKTAVVWVGVFILLDIVSGLAKALKARELHSGTMRDGLYHKMGFIGMLVLAVCIELAQASLELGFNVPLMSPAAVYIILTEIISIAENLNELNPEISAFIGKYLHKESE